MKLVSYTRLGQGGFGALKNGGIVDLTGRFGPETTTLKQAIAQDRLGDARGFVTNHDPDLSFSDVTLLPVIPDPSKILCIGVNYDEHKKETGRPDVGHPTVFTRFADSQVAHGHPMVRPKGVERFDFEGELAVVIGRGGRAIAPKDALSHVAGYACYMDGSVRCWQRHTSQFTPGKTFPGTGGFGPYLVTPDEVGDYTKLPIETRLNGAVMQKATLADLIFPIETLINYCSTFTPLSAGDVIVTGTPGGVGDRREPPVYMKPGDKVEIDLGVVGVLKHPVIDETQFD